MKRYRSYLRTVMLSIIAAIVIDAIINFEEYKRGWASNFKKEQEDNYPTRKGGSRSWPVEIGKATGAVIGIIAR